MKKLRYRGLAGYQYRRYSITNNNYMEVTNMKILTQDRTKIINFPKSVFVRTWGNYAEVCYGREVLLGRYINEERAKDILIEILQNVDHNSKIYIMPEK